MVTGRLGKEIRIPSTSRLVVCFHSFPSLVSHRIDSKVAPNPVGHTGVDRKIFERILHSNLESWKETPTFTVSGGSYCFVPLFFIISCPTHTQPSGGTVAVGFEQSSKTVKVGESLSLMRGAVIPRVLGEFPLPFFFLSVLLPLGTRPRHSCWKYMAEQEK